MGNALPAVQLLFYLLGGLGLFFPGLGALWFTDLYKKKNDMEHGAFDARSRAPWRK